MLLCQCFMPSQPFWGYKCSMPFCEVDFFWMKQVYGTFSTVISMIFWSFFLAKKLTLAWMEDVMLSSWTTKQMDRHIHVNCHCWCYFMSELSCSLKCLVLDCYSLLLWFNYVFVFCCFAIVLCIVIWKINFFHAFYDYIYVTIAILQYFIDKENYNLDVCSVIITVTFLPAFVPLEL